jgi:hypothetical protein
MFTTLLAIVGAVLGAASMLLHAIAPHTKTTVDDKAAVIVDEVKDALPKA